MSVSASENDISLNLGVYNLGDDVLVREADNEAIFGAVVLVLCLGDQTLASVVVGLAFSVFVKRNDRSCISQ